jgi:2-polyprenyl-3-methyl-5-hydroxy-6-metoxy-1,4-benzoquinol methylase
MVGVSEYQFFSSKASHTNSYLSPIVLGEIDAHLSADVYRQVFDLGCGNGAFLAELSRRGFQATGIDPSTSGVRQANAAWPHLRVEIGSAYDDLASKFGQYPIVVSLEVVEHLYSPRTFAKSLFDLVTPGGFAIVSTPYHGYLKNLALAVTGNLDAHFTALWDHGHIKFWSVSSLCQLLSEAGFVEIEFRYAGRVYPFSKSMVAVARRPAPTSP